MLDKIITIGLDLNNKSANYYPGYGSFPHRKKAGFYCDTMERSEALEYIFALDWHIKALNFQDDEKIAITFDASGIEFRTTINYYQRIINETKYLISQEMKDDELPKNITLSLSLQLTTDNPQRERKELEGITRLFKRLAAYDISSAKTADDLEIIGNLYDDIFYEIYFDLTYITRSLFTLILKMTGARVYSSDHPSGASFILHKINTSS